MKWPVLTALFVVAVAAAFWAGSRHGRHHAVSPSPAAARQVLYYVDPMNPAHTSDKPGKAPCGMDMEPVYADVAALSALPVGNQTMPPGTIKISLERQQLIGVRVAPVERKPLTHSIRLLGKVAADETRIYLVNATIDGWITKAGPQSSGTYVKKDETLATFYSSEFLAAGHALLFALNSQDRVRTNTDETPVRQSQLAQFERNLKQYTDSLRYLGMGERQLEEMIRTRQYMENINIVSPANGFVLARNVSDGQRFEKGTELFRIADLSRVWILADVFEKEARLLPPNLRARVSLPEQDKTFTATLTETLPQFDGVSRTLKLRFEAENPDFVMKPDMFVDLELSVSLPESLVVPAEAVLDAGLRKTVFVDRGNGFFEPRVVQTGAQLGSQVQILHGLKPGEQIVISGNFLLDSESRMKLAAAGVHAASAIDPVCGMTVDEVKARAANRLSQYQGQNYYFCSDGCKKRFDADPAKHRAETKARSMDMATSKREEPTDPVCGMRVDVAEAKAAKLTSERGSQTYFFCNDECKKQFDADPATFTQKAAKQYSHPAMTQPAHTMPQPAAAAPAESTVVDPVCAMVVDPAKAAAVNRSATYLQYTFYFCSDICKSNFEAYPVKYVENSLHGYYLDPPASMPKVAPETEARDPVCGMTVRIEKASAAGRMSEHLGKTYYFCNDGCKKEFELNPAKYLKEAAKK